MSYHIIFRVLSCGFVCELPRGVASQEIDTIVHANSYDVHFKSQSESQRLVYRNTISPLLKHREKPMKDHSTSRVLTNDPFFNSTPSKVGDKNIFFPVPQLYEIDCSYTETNATCIFDKKDFINDSIEESAVKTFRVRITHDAQKNSEESEVQSYWVNAVSLNNVSESSDDYDGIDFTSCQDSFTQVHKYLVLLCTNQTSRNNLHNPSPLKDLPFSKFATAYICPQSNLSTRFITYRFIVLILILIY